MLYDILYPLLNIDVKTLVSVLFWGNMVSVLLVFSYKFSTNHDRDKSLLIYFVLAKSFQSAAYFLIFFRWYIPNFFSVNLGNIFLFIGFFWEARAMLNILKEENKVIIKTLFVILMLTVASFNTLVFLLPDSSAWVMLASTCLFILIIIPTLKFFTTKNVSFFKKLVGIFYLFFLLLLMPRAIYAFFTPMHILTNSFIQTLTFLSLVLLMIFSLSAYLLLMKENSDKLINEMATRDGLTGLSNRRYFMETAERLFERHRRDQATLAIIFFDIDYFKKVNDNYGHAFGDVVIECLGTIIHNSLRSMDLASRYGGEEFVVLLPASGLDTAKIVSERIMGEVAGSDFVQHPGFKFTISGGIMVGVPGDTDSLEQYLKQGDHAMYQAKRSGRNKVVEYKPV